MTSRSPQHGGRFADPSALRPAARRCLGGAGRKPGSTASYQCIDTQQFFCVGLEVNANHLRGLRSGRVTAVARAVHLGRSTHVWDIRLHGDDGRTNCISRLTVAIVPHGSPPPQG